MANKEEFKNSLSRMFRARIPFISIRSIERSRVLEIIQQLSEEINIPIYIHSLSHGTMDIKTRKTVNDDRSVAGGIDFAVQNISQRQNVTFIFTEVSDIEDDNIVSRHIYDCVVQAIEKGGSICIISTKSVWSQLQRLGMTLTLDPPNEEEMLTVVKDCVIPYKGSIPIDWDENDLKMAATILANMTKIEAENVLATQMAKGSLTKDDIKCLSMEKDKLFSDISGLEKVKVDPSLISVGGLSGLHQWIDNQKQLLTADLRSRKLRPPRGVLLVGVPGCGKSLSAKFIAATWNLPLYRLDFASIQGMYVGQSENRLKEAFESADNAAPCILWIDEIEKGLAASANDSSGVTTRMIGQFLFWLQESTEKVFVVATANDVTKLPPELLRKGRFDELFFVDLPQDQERADIINLYIKKNLLPPPSSSTFEKLVAISAGFAGSDLEGAVRDVAIQAVINGDSFITDDLYEKCFQNIVPLSKTSPERIEAIRNWGKERALPASGLAWDLSSNDISSARRAIII
ncbi:AAA family ATPase [Chryseobacterium sp. W4I1]|uniref:AAA family ATPase n=1 Tax=Chryseobacterium sp. W4I1 TaxID=3042293 RepID=UPI002789C972|nr:AAA family ATPase [Chryseobacterium sp. W4I1]MDQ0783740.1 ATP-dependent 26S proteasome regulatory subunit [Chryseobacterium sp. W4I1]